MQRRGIRPPLAERGKSHGFLEWRQEPRVYSRVTVGMVLRVSSATSGLLSSYE